MVKHTKRLKNIVAIIKKKRIYLELSQEYMAFKLGITQNGYSKIELGQTKLTVDRLFEITDILEIAISDLLY